MADNVSITPGTGVTVASDDIGTVQYQRVKLALGPDGTYSGDAQTPLTDGIAATGMLHTSTGLFNGSSYDRLRSANYAAGFGTSPNTGILPVITPDLRYSSQTLNTASGSTVQWDLSGQHSAMVRFNGSATGSWVFEVTNDGTNYAAVRFFDISTGYWYGTNNTFAQFTAGQMFMIPTKGYSTLRVRATQTLTATVNISAILTPLDAYPDLAPQQHQNAAKWFSTSSQYTTQQTSTTVVSGISNRTVVTSYQIQVFGTTAGTVQLYMPTSIGATAYSRGSSVTLFDGEFAPSATLKPGVVQTGTWVALGASHSVYLTTSAAMSLTVTVSGYYSYL